MALPLCIIAIMALSCVFFNRVSSKLGIPALLAFIPVSYTHLDVYKRQACP